MSHCCYQGFYTESGNSDEDGRNSSNSVYNNTSYPATTGSGTGSGTGPGGTRVYYKCSSSYSIYNNSQFKNY